MSDRLYPFVVFDQPVNPVPPENVSPFDYLKPPSIPSFSNLNGIEFFADAPVELLSILDGKMFFSPNSTTNYLPDNLTERLFAANDNPPAPGDLDPDFTFDLVIIPFTKLKLPRLYKLLDTQTLGNPLAIRYSGLKFSNLKTEKSNGWQGRPTLGSKLGKKLLVFLNQARQDKEALTKLDDTDLRYFMSGAYNINIGTGTHLATLDPQQRVRISILTSLGYVDPIEFYEMVESLLVGFFDLNNFKTSFPKSNIPLFNYGEGGGNTIGSFSGVDFQEILDLGKDNLFSSSYLNIISDAFAGSNGYSRIAGEFPGEGQKSYYLNRLHQIGKVGTDGVHQETENYRSPFQWFDNSDIDNIVQLEALTEFYMNFRNPMGGSAPLLPDNENYRKIDFSSDEVTEVLEKEKNVPASDPLFIPADPYPKRKFPYIFVLVDDFEFVGGQLEWGNSYDCRPFSNQRPQVPERDRYRGILFILERFQRFDSEGLPIGHPKLIGIFPWSTHASQFYPKLQDRSSILGNHQYIFVSSPGATNPRINYAFHVANSYLPKPLQDLERYNKLGGAAPFSRLPGVIDPLGFTLDPIHPSKVDEDGKGAIFLHRGQYSVQNRSTSGSQGCLVSPQPRFYEARKAIIWNYLNKYSVDKERKKLLIRLAQSGHWASIKTYNPVSDEFKKQKSEDEVEKELARRHAERSRLYTSSLNRDHLHLRGLLYVIRPNEPNLNRIN